MVIEEVDESLVGSLALHYLGVGSALLVAALL